MQMSIDEAILERLQHFDDNQKRRLLEIVEKWDSSLGVPGVSMGDLLDSGLVGIWADREDIPDSISYARELRQRMSRRASS